MTRLAFLVVLILATATPGFAQCQSRAYDDQSDYLEYKEAGYTICYSAEYPDDLDFINHWVSKAFDLGRDKYGVIKPELRGKELTLTIFAPPERTAATGQGTVRWACCYDDEENSDVWHSELHYMTPSAWKGGLLGGLRQPPEYYHPHYITHEIVHFFQWTCCRDDREYSWPTWVTEGMAESDGYRYTTEYSRTMAIEKLNDLVKRSGTDDLGCCSNLAMEEGWVVSSVYWVGGWVMNFLAEKYGDEVHLELLRNDLPTVLTSRGNTVEEVFQEMVGAIADDTPTVSGEYTAPLVACTGTYWRTNSGNYSFGVNILNNLRRPPDHRYLYDRYRSNSSQAWVEDGGTSVVNSNSDTYGVSLPLFTGPSSRPFEWQARSCSVETRGECSNWSNTLQWTAARCANTEVR